MTSSENKSEIFHFHPKSRDDFILLVIQPFYWLGNNFKPQPLFPNMTEYYYAQGKQHLGPFTLQELRQENLKPDTYIWWPSSPDWQQAKDVPELQDLFWNQPPPTPKKRPITTSRPRSGSNPGNGYPPKSWLIESILVTLFCCQVFGIVAIVYAAQVESKFKQGDILGAEFTSRKARFWVYLSFWLMAGAFILIACFAILMNLLGHTQ